ncbi:MAG: alpha/beta fold hydrolase [Pseudomonadota bacterium]
MSANLNFSTGNIISGGCKIAYRIDGALDRPWLIFSNSLATTMSLWDGQVSYLGQSFRILRYDQRGHGASAIPDHPCTFAELADDVIALMDHLGIEQAALAGVSMGAVTVLSLAARYPQRVERVLACDGQWQAPAGAAQAWAARIATAGESGMAELVDPTLARWFSPAFLAGQSAALEKVREMIASTPAQGFIQCARALQAYELREEIAGIRVPCLLLVGADDGALPGVMRQMADAIPTAGYVEVANAGHLPNIDCSDTFNAEAAHFLMAGSDRHGAFI